jgi:cell division septation protein DedD
VGSDTKSKAKARIEELKPKTVAVAAAAIAVASSKYGSFGVLAVDESSSEDECHQETQEIKKPQVQNTPAPVAVAPAPARDPTKPLTWAERAAAAASKPTPSPASSSAPASSKLLGDARFALHHALSENITVSKRAPPRGTPNESSKKRKQESVTVPA